MVKVFSVINPIFFVIVTPEDKKIIDDLRSSKGTASLNWIPFWCSGNEETEGVEETKTRLVVSFFGRDHWNEFSINGDSPTRQPVS